jgi:streptogramin lyase
LGEYKSAPRIDGNPSRTTVDKDGSVWLSNRNDIGPNRRGTIVHIGLLENNQCEDRNGDNVIQTSTGLGDIKPWAAGGTRGVQFAEDECIVHYTEVSSTGTRHVSIDADNNVWVSGSGYEAFDKVKGGRYDTVDVDGKHSGDILKSFPSVGYGGYGGLMDPNSVIWSANYLLRWDTSKPLDGPNGDPAGDSSIGPHDKNWAGQTSPGSYGLCIDSQGNVWNTELGSGIHKYAPNGAHIARYTHGFSAAQGCVVDKNDDVWVAHSILNGGQTVGHLRNDGTYLGSVTVGNGPSGVAVDKAGKIWATNTQSSTLSRIDPALGIAGEVDMTVELGSGCYPYNYGDMTGSTNIAPPNTGSWTVMYDYGSVLATWGGMNIEWTAVTPGDSSVTVQVKNNEADP